MPADAVPLPRLLLMIWEVRGDLQRAFDPGSAASRLGLLHWFLFHGLAEYGLKSADLPDYLYQAVAAEAVANGEALPLLHRLILLQRDDVTQAFDIVTPQAPTIMPSRSERPKVVLTGCLSEPSGRGEDMRMTMAALDAHGIPYLTIDRIDRTARDRAGNIFEPDTVADAAVNIVHLNADTAFADYMFLRQFGVRRARVVGYWAWELAKFPEEYRTAFSFFDEIWASTRFAFSAFDIGNRPVSLMPMPVALPERMSSLSRGHFRLPESRFLFLFNFDFGSFCARKNPEAAIAAFRAAFPSDPQVGLVIKTINAERFTEQWNWLKEATEGDRRIIMRNGRYTRDEMLNLIRLCDCYVSLHRSEGFGRGPAEAMLLGRPVVATNYSGNIDFMNAENSFPVDYRLVPVREGEYPGARGQVWAEPDIAHAAAQMERVYRDHAEARRMAKEAAHFIATRYSARAIGANYARWLQQILPELHGARSRRDRRRRTRAVATMQGAAAVTQ
jgi:glycosyltransferase involved in cell wall biosynthesis